VSQPRRLGPQRMREPREQREARRLAEAIAALDAAGGICDRCERPSPALKAVRIPGDCPTQVDWAAECVDPTRCDRQLRESLREAA
jgi:hypothetical protein